MTRHNGFTLAEVLITLGIIGVVAAMTMPTLINQTNGAQYRAAYKKALSAISQGVTLNVALDDISFADTDAASTVNSKAGDKSIAGILMSRMNVVKIDDGSGYGTAKPADIEANVCTQTDDDNETTIVTCSGNATDTKLKVSPDVFLYFNDSSMLAINGDDKGCTKISTDKTKNTGCFGVIDVNGLKGPNKPVKCDSDTGACEVKSPTDIYPVVYYDQTILPASDAASAVLYGK